ncbi:hypothetical protein R1sor_019800 [Riccia sorocarpa]|uniref:Uncharacterized protein n=1 Tax=Riccia sorocarpa TaxID=122646 RepID=A0ABD3IDN6_9MARC
MEISLTVGQTGRDIKPGVFEKLCRYVDAEANIGLLVLEYGDTQLQLLVQGILKVKMSSIRAFKADLAVMLGWNTRCPPGGSKHSGKLSVNLTMVEHIDIEVVLFDNYKRE